MSHSRPCPLAVSLSPTLGPHIHTCPSLSMSPFALLQTCWYPQPPHYPLSPFICLFIHFFLLNFFLPSRSLRPPIHWPAILHTHPQLLLFLSLPCPTLGNTGHTGASTDRPNSGRRAWCVGQRFCPNFRCSRVSAPCKQRRSVSHLCGHCPAAEQSTTPGEPGGDPAPDQF